MSLLNDIFRCLGGDHYHPYPIREECKRYVYRDSGDPFRTPIADYSKHYTPMMGCDHQIKMEATSEPRPE